MTRLIHRLDNVRVWLHAVVIWFQGCEWHQAMVEAFQHRIEVEEKKFIRLLIMAFDDHVANHKTPKEAYDTVMNIWNPGDGLVKYPSFHHARQALLNHYLDVDSELESHG